MVTKDGKLTRRVEDIIRTYEDMGVDIKATLNRALENLQHAALMEQIFGEDRIVVGGKLQTTKDRIRAIREILAAL